MSTLATNVAAVIEKLINWQKSVTVPGTATSSASLMSVGVLSSVCLATVVGIANIVRLWKEFSSEHVDAPTYGLQSALLIVLNGLKAEHKKGPDPKLRFCVHVLDEKRNAWIQRTDYVGVCAGTGKGRVQAISKGVVGDALRSGRISSAKVKKNQTRTELLIAQGYTSEEVAEMRGDTMSWIAIPIAHPDRPGSPFAVLYGDSSVPDFFDANYSVRKKILEACVLGVAEFCKPSGKG